MTTDATAVLPHRVAYPITELASMFGKKPRYFRGLVARGEIPHRRLGREIFIPADFVAQFGPLPGEAT